MYGEGNHFSLPGAPPIQPKKYEYYSYSEDSIPILINEDIKKALLKIGAEYTMKDGKERSVVDIIELLIKEHNQTSRV